MNEAPRMHNQQDSTLVRLVVEFNVTDGCTFHCRATRPVLYSSAEAFAVEFEEACRTNRGATLNFAGQQFPVDAFFEDETYFGPDVWTVDEWFSRHAPVAARSS